MKKEIEKSQFEQDTSNVLGKTLITIAEGLTGIASSERKEVILSIGHIFQRLRAGQFLSQLKKEWDAYRKKGKIKEDYIYSEQHKVCLHELLDFLERDIPDEYRFHILKQIFLVAATEEKSDRNSVLPQQYIKICRTLPSGEIIVLNTIYQIVMEKSWAEEPHYSSASWVNVIKEESGLKFSSLVEIHEQGLVDKKLLSPRLHPDRSGVSVKPYFRLTDLGFEICNYIKDFKRV